MKRQCNGLQRAGEKLAEKSLGFGGEVRARVRVTPAQFELDKIERKG